MKQQIHRHRLFVHHFLLLGLLAALAFSTLAATAMEPVICSVCRVHEGETEPEEVVATAEHDGAMHGFCSAACRDKFVENPEVYLPPTFPRPAPTFAARALDGTEFSSESLEGRTVLLDFWATWCPPCIEDLPKLTALHERYEDRGLTVVSVSIDEGDDAAKKVARMIKKRKARHPVYLDSLEEPAWGAYRVAVVPTQFLINGSGEIVAQWSGKVDLDVVEAEIRRLIVAEP